MGCGASSAVAEAHAAAAAAVDTKATAAPAADTQNQVMNPQVQQLPGLKLNPSHLQPVRVDKTMCSGDADLAALVASPGADAPATQQGTRPPLHYEGSPSVGGSFLAPLPTFGHKSTREAGGRSVPRRRHSDGWKDTRASMAHTHPLSNPWAADNKTLPRRRRSESSSSRVGPSPPPIHGSLLRRPSSSSSRGSSRGSQGGSDDLGGDDDVVFGTPSPVCAPDLRGGGKCDSATDDDGQSARSSPVLRVGLVHGTDERTVCALGLAAHSTKSLFRFFGTFGEVVDLTVSDAKDVTDHSTAAVLVTFANSEAANAALVATPHMDNVQVHTAPTHDPN
jgi:hypothetical protein